MALKESPAPVTTDKGLQAGALGLVGNVVIGLAAVAPAYSLAATLGFVVLAPDYGYTAFGRSAACSSSTSVWAAPNVPYRSQNLLIFER